jgi:hypothetical protein
MVRLLSRQHGRNRPLLPCGADKTAEAAMGEDLSLQSLQRMSCEPARFSRRNEAARLPRGSGSTRHDNADTAGWRRSINDEIRRTSMTCPRRN